MTRPSSSRGFTLVELMIAVSVLAVMMTLVYGVVVSSVQAAQRVEEISAGTEVGPAILTRIRADLEAAFLPKEGDYFLGYDRKGAGGDRDRLDFVSAVLGYGPERDGDVPSFHSVNELGYQLRDHPTEPGVGVLYRREDFFLDAEPLKGGRLVELYDRVTVFDVEYWDGKQWRAQWSAKTEKNKLPRAVRVRLTLRVGERDEPGAERAYLTTVILPR